MVTVLGIVVGVAIVLGFIHYLMNPSGEEDEVIIEETTIIEEHREDYH